MRWAAAMIMAVVVFACVAAVSAQQQPPQQQVASAQAASAVASSRPGAFVPTEPDLLPNDIGCSPEACYASSLGAAWWLGPGASYTLDLTVVCPIARTNYTTWGGITGCAPEHFAHCSLAHVTYYTSDRGNCSVQIWTVDYRIYNGAWPDVSTFVHIAWRNQSTPSTSIKLDIITLTNSTVLPPPPDFGDALRVADSARAALASPSVCVLTPDDTAHSPPCYLPARFASSLPELQVTNWNVLSTMVIDPQGVVRNHSGLVLPDGGAYQQYRDDNTNTLHAAFSLWLPANQVASLVNSTFVYELQQHDDWFYHPSDFVAVSLRAGALPCPPAGDCKLPLWAKLAIGLLGGAVLLLVGLAWWLRAQQPRHATSAQSAHTTDGAYRAVA